MIVPEDWCELVVGTEWELASDLRGGSWEGVGARRLVAGVSVGVGLRLGEGIGGLVANSMVNGSDGKGGVVGAGFGLEMAKANVVVA